MNFIGCRNQKIEECEKEIIDLVGARGFEPPTP